jgi:prepilin-type N-terminal cleavage/methylation domain-containing protein
LEREQVNPTRRRTPVRSRDEAGFSLTELIIVVVLLGMVMGALSASFLVSMNGNSSATQRVKESNDAQTIAAFLVRDAQAAGGSDPATGSADPTLGVSLGDNGGCTGTGTLVVRFKWLDRVTATTTHTRVASYYYDAANHQLTRQTCSDGASTGGLTLASNVGTTPVPTASCIPAAACNPTGFPDSVQLQGSAINNPSNATTPYSYTLQASLRADSEVAPTLGNSVGVPLLVLGGGSCPALSSNGNTDVTINGVGAVNATDSGNCNAMSTGNNGSFTATNGIGIVQGGTCGGGNCPPVSTLGGPMPDPFSGLTAPAVSCASGSDPATTVVGGVVHYHSGVYHSALSISGTAVFDPGLYAFCQNLTFQASANVSGSGVTLYLAQNAGLSITGQSGLALSAPSSGTYANLLIWLPATNSTTTLSLTGGVNVNTFAGAVYAPNADVKLGGGAGMSVGMIVAKTITFIGTSGSTVGVPPLSIASPASLATSTAGVGYSSVQFNGAGGYPAYTWSATGLPSGMTLDSTGLLHGTPSTAGSYNNIVVTVVDSRGDTTQQTYSLTINAAVHVTTSSLPAATQGSAYSTTLAATGGTGPLTWTVTGALPAGLTFDAASATISGTPTVTGTFPVTIQASDGLGSGDSAGPMNLVVGATPLAATDVVLANGSGTLGHIDAGDTVTVTFNKAIAVASMCAAWSNDANNQSLNANNQVVVTINDNAGPSSHDTLTVTSSACTFRFGVLDLGSSLWVTASRTFSGSGGNRSSVTYNATTHVLTVTLGAASGATAAGVAAQTVVYTPNTSLTDTYGNAAAGSFTAANQRF